MTDTDFMKLAIEEAKKSVDAGGAPIGAVLVKGDKVFETGWSLVWPKKDPSAHGETECMRKACHKLQAINLTGYTLYSTLESCSLCLGCAGWCNLSKIVFGAYKEDTPDNPYELSDYHAEEHAKRFKNLEVVGGILREECKSLMSNIKNWSPVE
ncbi:nucleoside deaminase [Patescibacteria group bacterium]|nr:nucleoside deaminase [Patescibacteria group bacterium]